MPIVQDIYGRTALDIAFTSDEDSIYQVLISRIKEFIQLLFRSKQKKIIFKPFLSMPQNRSLTVLTSILLITVYKIRNQFILPYFNKNLTLCQNIQICRKYTFIKSWILHNTLLFVSMKKPQLRNIFQLCICRPLQKPASIFVR